VFADCYADWYEFMEWLADNVPSGDREDYYAYPELRVRVHAPRTREV
jgi:hypothetical protein